MPIMADAAADAELPLPPPTPPTPPPPCTPRTPPAAAAAAAYMLPPRLRSTPMPCAIPAPSSKPHCRADEPEFLMDGRPRFTCGSAACGINWWFLHNPPLYFATEMQPGYLHFPPPCLMQYPCRLASVVQPSCLHTALFFFALADEGEELPPSGPGSVPSFRIVSKTVGKSDQKKSRSFLVNLIGFLSAA